MSPLRSSSRAWFLSVSGLATIGLAITFAAAPAWWQSRGVIDSAQTTNDYAAVNTGQVKNIATLARDEMNAALPGGAGAIIDSLVNSFGVINGDRNDYAAVNVGQLKTVTKPFYDRLIAVGYTTSYPWSNSDPARNDYAQVNTGQVKNLFSFDLTADTNANGLPDWWEIKTYGSLGAATGAADGDSDGLTNAEEYALGTNPQTAADMSATASSAIGLVIHTVIGN